MTYHSLLSIDSLLLVITYYVILFIYYFFLLTPYSLLLTPYFLLLISYVLLFTSYFLLLASYFLLLTSYFLLLTTYFLLLTSYFLLLTALLCAILVWRRRQMADHFRMLSTAPPPPQPGLPGAVDRGHCSKDFGRAQGRGIVFAIFAESPHIQLYRKWGQYKDGKFAFYAREANALCQSLREHSPHLPISVVTDKPALVRTLKCQFDRVIKNAIPLKNTPWAEKPAALLQSPYAETLFLDSDTHVCQDVRPIFNFLDEYDFVAVQEPYKMMDLARDVQEPKHVRASWVAGRRWFEINTGVLAFKSTLCVRRFFLRGPGSSRTCQKGRSTFFHFGVGLASFPGMYTSGPCSSGPNGICASAVKT